MAHTFSRKVTLEGDDVLNAMTGNEASEPTPYIPHPLRIQRRRVKGWRMPEGAVSVTRPGRWGNPFTVSSEYRCAATKEEAAVLCVRCFRDWLYGGELSEWWLEAYRDQWFWMRANLHRLHVVRLACYCPLDRPCHADVLAEFAAKLAKHVKLDRSESSCAK